MNDTLERLRYAVILREARAQELKLQIQNLTVYTFLMGRKK